MNFKKKTKSKTVTTITTIAETEASEIVFELVLFFTDIISVGLFVNSKWCTVFVSPRKVVELQLVKRQNKVALAYILLCLANLCVD